MIRIRTACLGAMVLLSATAGYANPKSSIASWVDDDGVTHFGSPQFAPPEQHEVVNVRPTNGMAVPVTAAINQSPRHNARVVTLERTKLKNKRGFRGHAARPRNAGDRRRRR